MADLPALLDGVDLVVVRILGGRRAWEDGLDALRYVETRLPAAVVLDLGLPRLHGRDVQREMAAQGLTDQIPIIVVTGEEGPINEQEYTCVLRKPAAPHAVVEAVRRCLAFRRA